MEKKNQTEIIMTKLDAEGVVTFEEAWELWERVKHRTKDGFVPDTSQRIDVLYQKVPAIMRLLKSQHDALAALSSDLEETIARAFICEYCGLLPEHVTNEDIEVFFRKDTSQTNGAAQALKVAIRAYLQTIGGRINQINLAKFNSAKDKI